ncbi:MAG: hypothetical protein COA69_00680 [Robiginitomaculum sp.]|nr:MAG: hypothetical protein COA69_00680 [Robiginitomaculum sp.]
MKTTLLTKLPAKLPTKSLAKFSLGVGIASALLLQACTNTSMAAAEEMPKQVYSYDAEDKCYYTSACYSVVVGSSEINTARLKPYHAIWSQSNPDKDGAWVKSPATFEEILKIGADGQWIHVQKSHMGGGMAQVQTRTLDKKTWQVLDMTITYENGPSNAPQKVFYDLTGDNFTADITLSDGKHQTGKVRKKALAMFDGQIGGLTLAALPLSENYTATLPMIIPNLGIYWIEATVVGRKTIPTADGSSQDVWEVNANWFNLTDGDIYEPGREGDGGVYYIAVNPGDGVPSVIEYANSGAVISWDGVRRK